MHCYSTASTTSGVPTDEADVQRTINKDSDIDLSSRDNLECGYYSVHISHVRIMCHGVPESNENEDIILNNCEAGSTHDSEECQYACKSFHIGEQHNFIEIIDAVYFIHWMKFKKTYQGKQCRQMKVACGKRRNNRGMKANTRYLQHKIASNILKLDNASQLDRRSHKKRCSSLKRYKMFKFRMFLFALINLRVHNKASDISNGQKCIIDEDAEQTTTDELSLRFCVKKNKLQFYLCDAKKYRQADSMFFRRTDPDMKVGKVSFSEAFETVLHDEMSADLFVDISEVVLHDDLFGNSSLDIDNALRDDLSREGSVDIDNTLRDDLSGEGSVDIDKNALRGDLSVDSSVKIHENALHNDLSGDSAVKICGNALHSDLSGESAVKICENALHNDLSRDSSVKIHENSLHSDLSGDSCVKIRGNSLHSDLSGDSCVKIHENSLHNDLSRDSSVKIRGNSLHNNLPGDSCVKIRENALHKDLSGDRSVKICGNALHNDLSGDRSVKICGNALHNDLSGNSSVTICGNDINIESSVKICGNVLHDDLSGNSLVKICWNDLDNESSVKICGTDLHKELSGNRSVTVCGNDLYSDLSRNRSVTICRTDLHKELSGDRSVTICRTDLHKELSGDRSVTICENDHSDLSGGGSVQICGNVLRNYLSVEGSVDIIESILHDDLSGEHSVDDIENVLHDDLSGDSSIDIIENVLHDDLCGEHSVDDIENVLHDDLSGEHSIDDIENVLHDDLSGGHSVDIIENVLHDDLSEDSPFKICGNGRHNESSVKICGNDLHNDLPEDNSVLHDILSGNSSKSFKTNKIISHDVLFENNPFKTSKPFHNVELGINDAVHMKTIESGVLKLKSGDDYIRSYVDLLKYLGIYPRYSPNLPLFWQEITLYPFTRHDPQLNNPHGDLHQLMCYEVFRLCSFSYARFPADFDVWVTQLAQAGFYCEDANGRIVCFHCEREFQGTVGSSVENVHHPECRYHEHSRPLHVWTEGLDQEVLTVYYNRYGSLRPYNFEVSSQQRLSDYADIAHEAIQGPSVTEPQTQRSSVTEPQAQSFSEQASGSSSVGRDSGVPILAEVNREDSAFEEAARPQYHSEALPAEPNLTNRDHGFGDDPQSLPSNLNDVSGGIVSEESQGSPGSYQVLTSAAKNPMPFYNTATRGSHSQAVDENGAVGGAGAALDLSKASYPLFSSAEARRQTFTTWSPSHSHQPEDLVAGGFFYAGYADCVRCFYCGLGLKYWRPTDIPAYQHARYRPHCVYNRLYKGQDYIDRVQQDLRSEQGPTNQLVEPLSSSQGELITRAVTTRAVTTAAVATPAVATPARVQDEITSVTGTPSVTAPNVPDLINSDVAQEAMRNGWERNQVQQAVDKIVQEIGVDRLEIGLLLDVLTNLNMDNPDRNLPSGGSTGSADSGINDNAVLPSSAAAEIVNVVNVGRGVDVGDATWEGGNAALQVRAVPIQQPAVPPIEFNELFRSVEREHTLLAERTTCRLCRRRPVSCIYLPCGHVIACQECADNATHCILCSRQIIGTANIYLA